MYSLGLAHRSSQMHLKLNRDFVVLLPLASPTHNKGLKLFILNRYEKFALSESYLVI